MKCKANILKYTAPEAMEYVFCGGEMEEKGVLKMEDFTDVKLYQCKSCKNIQLL